MDLVRLAVEQSAAVILGVAVVSIVAPTTPGGNILIFAMTIAGANLIFQGAKFAYSKYRSTADAGIGAEPPDRPKTPKRRIPKAGKV
jgi:hypothetical protein